jgi:transcriptional regulator with XRE-family HTH domain
MPQKNVNSPKSVRYATLVGQTLSWYRQLAAVEQTTVADAVGVTQSTWSKIERGESALTVEQFAKAASALGRSPLEIMQAVEHSLTQLQLQGVQVLRDRPNPPISGGALLGIAALALLIAKVISG